MLIRPAVVEDYSAIWGILEPVIRAGESYALPREMSQADALAYWTAPEKTVFVAEDAGDVVGTYYLRANQQGPGSHVANCGYVTASQATGRGVARAMCEDSLRRAAQNRFLAMQFNFVASSNVRAVRLWERFGFGVVGRLPGAFAHPKLGFVDALVMFKAL
jgi:ribosomal protein S18 acetylase RimI-like enzyme